MRKINSVDQMREIGSKIGAQLRGGDLVVLSGGLGAGKTALTQGIGSALGISNVTSDRKSTRLNSSHVSESRMPSSA